MKRKRKARIDERANKRPKTEVAHNGSPTWALLRCYNPRVLTLRQDLAWTLRKSKRRQKSLLHYGLQRNGSRPVDSDSAVADLLDTELSTTQKMTHQLTGAQIQMNAALHQLETHQPTASQQHQHVQRLHKIQQYVRQLTSSNDEPTTQRNTLQVSVDINNQLNAAVHPCMGFSIAPGVTRLGASGS